MTKQRETASPDDESIGAALRMEGGILTPLVLDLALISSLMVVIFTHDVVLGFHAAFVFLTFAAFRMSIAHLLFRLLVVTAVSAGRLVVLWSHHEVDVDELIEVGPMVVIILVVFITARRRNVLAAEVNRQRQSVAELGEAARELSGQIVRAQRHANVGLIGRAAAHDFNAALSVLQARTEVVEAKASDPDSVKHNVREMQMAIVYAAALVDQLASSTDDDEADSTSDLSNAVDHGLRMLKGAIGSKIDIEVDVDRELLVSLPMTHAVQAVVNLVANGVEAMPSGGTLTVSARVDESSRSVVLTVSDTGRGMDQDQLDQAFDLFYSTKRSDDGSGIGLYAVREVVARAGGKASLDSTVGHGTTATLDLPMSTAESIGA